MTSSGKFELRGTLLRGGLLLGARQVFAMGLAAFGMIVTIRILGPTEYGIYVTAFGVHQFTFGLGQAGIETYLVRGMKEIGDREYNVASSFLAIFGSAVALFEATCLPRIGYLFGLAGALTILPLLALSLPLQLVTAPAVARLDRDLKFGAIAKVDIASQVIFYAIGVPLALAGWGAWALGTSWVVQQALACALYHLAARWTPVPTWDGAALKRMLGYALSYSSSGWLWQAKSLVNPIVVGGSLGVEAVGFVNVAIRIVELLSFARLVGWRVSVPGFARFQTDPTRLLAAIAEGTELQTIAVGIPLVFFASVGRLLISDLLGPSWLPALGIYPFIAIAYLTGCIFSLQTSALATIRRNLDVTLFLAVHLAIFVPAAYFIIPVSGLTGYGLAEIVALPTYLIPHFQLRRAIGAVSYRFILPWYVAFMLALYLSPFSAWVCALPLALLGWPRTWQRLIAHARSLRSGRGSP